MNIKSIVLMFAATALAACGSDSEDALILSEPLPLTVSAAIGTNTRLGTSSDGSEGFVAGDKIYITGTIGGKVQENLNGEAYKLDADGNWDVVTADNKFYYQTTSAVTFSASYIDDATMPSDGVLTNQAAKDFLFASGATGSVSTGGAVSFTFSHHMAKVAFKFANGKGGVTNATDIQSFTVEGLYTTGSYDTTTGETTPSSSSTTLSNQSAGAWIIVYPKEEGDIKVSFSFNNANYDVTLKKQSLVAGNSYEYTINVNNGGVTVQPTITQWSSGVEKSLSAAWTPVIISEKSKVLKYALAFSDGKFVNLLNADEISAISSSSSNAVAGLINNRIASIYNSTSYKESNVSGIVYFLNGADGYYLSTDKKLNSSYRNGLIIGKTTTATNWQDKAQSTQSGTEYIYINGMLVNAYYQNYSIMAVEGYNKKYSSAGYNSIADKTTIHGYSDTQLMKVYNNTIPYGVYISGVTNSIATYTKRAVNIVSKLNTSTITNTSGWYVPSYKEVELLFKEYFTSNFILRSTLNKLSVSFFDNCYWTSTEGAIDRILDNYVYYDVSTGYTYFNSTAYFCSHAYLFESTYFGYSSALCDKFATTYNDMTIYTLNVCAF